MVLDLDNGCSKSNDPPQQHYIAAFRLLFSIAPPPVGLAAGDRVRLLEKQSILA